jgi:hypothetical protein
VLPAFVGVKGAGYGGRWFRLVVSLAVAERLSSVSLTVGVDR